MSLRPVKLNNYLYEARQKRGMSRKQLARMLGFTNSVNICRWENGREVPSLRKAMAMAYLYGLPVEYLFRPMFDDEIREIQQRKEDNDKETSRGDDAP